jgi:hypothetical protein
MQKWEYRIISSGDIEGSEYTGSRSLDDIETFLNELGDEGWEVVSIDFDESGPQGTFTGVAKRAR